MIEKSRFILGALFITILRNKVFNLATRLSEKSCLVSSLIDPAIHDTLPYPEFFFPFYKENAPTVPSSSSNSYICNQTTSHILSNNDLMQYLAGSPSQKWVKDVYKRHDEGVYSHTPLSSAAGSDTNTYCLDQLCPIQGRRNLIPSWQMLRWNFSADAICALGDSLSVSVSGSSRKRVRVIALGGKLHTGLLSSLVNMSFVESIADQK